MLCSMADFKQEIADAQGKFEEHLMRAMIEEYIFQKKGETVKITALRGQQDAALFFIAFDHALEYFTTLNQENT